MGGRDGGGVGCSYGDVANEVVQVHKIVFKMDAKDAGKEVQAAA